MAQANIHPKIANSTKVEGPDTVRVSCGLFNYMSMPSPQFAEAERRIQQALETKAKSLDLSGLRLTALPRELCNLANLTWLNLDQNQLASLPRELGNLTKLTWLFLSKNQLESCVRLAGLPSSGDRLVS